jgi:hypothetical protein
MAAPRRLHFTIATAMMNQRLDGWLLADDPQHGNFSMGLANIELKHVREFCSGRRIACRAAEHGCHHRTKS